MAGAPQGRIQPIVRIQREDFDAGGEIARLTAGRKDIGATVSFCGLCRDEGGRDEGGRDGGGRLAALELEHYPGMAEAEIGRIAAQAAARWPLAGLVVVHRHGLIAAGERIVLVVAAAAHRQAAFEAASYVMDFLKTQAPFWKREHFADGTPGPWVETAAGDDEALARWRQAQPDPFTSR